MIANYFKVLENFSNILFNHTPTFFIKNVQSQANFYNRLVKYYTSPVHSFFDASRKYFNFVTKNRTKPDWGIHKIVIGDKVYHTDNKVVYANSFMELRFFDKQELAGVSQANLKKTDTKTNSKVKNGLADNFINDIKKEAKNGNSEMSVLLLAPLSGHYATLLIPTIKALLPHTKVYITDWRNISQVEEKEGVFGIDDYIDNIISSIDNIDGPCHVIAVCQPAPCTVIAAAKIAAERPDLEKKLKSLTLMGGPVDPQANPTEVSKLASSFPIEWFEKNFITEVPYGHKGYGRKVYPGFLQINAFISMNADRHLSAHIDYFNFLYEDNQEGLEKHQKFYNEYLSVMDISREFYLETIERIFQQNLVAKNKYRYRGKKVDIKKITKPRLIIIEGSKDDISAVGQSKSALKLLSGLSDDKKHYHLEEDVGHYGVFAGRHFKENIVPVLVEQFKIAEAK